MPSVIPSVERPDAGGASGGQAFAARRRAAVAATIAGFAVPVWFWVSEGLFGLVDPPEDAAAGDYIAFYLDNFSRLPRITTAYVGLWVLTLVLLVAVVRAAVTRLDLGALVAIGLAGASTAAAAIVEGVRAWPTLTFETAAQLADRLDPAVAALTIPWGIVMAIALLVGLRRGRPSASATMSR